MKLSAARMQKRMMLGLPIVWLGTALWHAGGGGAALLLWMAVCAFLPAARYPYPRKSRLHFARLFFAWAGGFFTLSVLLKICNLLLLPLPPLLPGISVLGVLSSAFAFNLSLEKRSHVLLGLLFFSAGM